MFLAKIHKITRWQAALIIAVLGFAVYFTGLTNPFEGDDVLQIVNNIPVHSIANIHLFFEGGTYYDGQGIAALSGPYYRPLMTTVFSLIYTVFGAHPFYFHLFQLLLYITSAIILYLVFRYSFKPGLALFLSLVFLVHPISSQVVYAIPTLQDALFFFFGILALWLLLRFKSIRSLLAVAVCLLLCLLSKESGIVFVTMAFLYLFWFDQRKRLYSLIGILVVPAILYILLRTHAVHEFTNPTNAPIDSLSVMGRFFTAPSIILFYLTKFVFPLNLASGYYWVYPTFSFSHFLIPLLVDLVVVALAIYMGFRIHKKAIKAMYWTYLYFGVWSTLGLLLTLQIIPLDMTACETWFYFTMAGVLGMIGVVLTVYPPHIRPSWLLIVGIVIVGALGFRTAIRGFDWGSQYTLALKDISASKDDYNANNYAAYTLIDQGKFSEAKPYAVQSINIYPTSLNYLNLGVILTNQGDYPGALDAYNHALGYGNSYLIYDAMATQTLLYGDTSTNQQFLLSALHTFPHDSTLWMYLAILEDRYNNNADAKIAISNAATYGEVPQFVYKNVMNNQSFFINLAGKKVVIQ